MRKKEKQAENENNRKETSLAHSYYSIASMCFFPDFFLFFLLFFIQMLKKAIFFVDTLSVVEDIKAAREYCLVPTMDSSLGEIVYVGWFLPLRD